MRFVNLMINDVTYLLDESLTDLAKIHDIQMEMKDRATFESKPLQYRREREALLRQLERHTSTYVQLGNNTVDLLKLFTGETKEPFMVPEIVDRLAAMLDYNLDALVGPRCQELAVSNREKYKFDPKRLLSDILQVYLNLSDQGEFARAVAADERSYRKELFEQAAAIAQRRMLKSPDEIEKLRLFVVKVEETRATLQAEDDLGDIPDEFLGEHSRVRLAACSQKLTLLFRSAYVHPHARPRHVAVVPGGRRQVHNQIALALGYQGSLQPHAPQYRGRHTKYVNTSLLQPHNTDVGLQMWSSNNG